MTEVKRQNWNSSLKSKWQHESEHVPLQFATPDRVSTRASSSFQQTSMRWKNLMPPRTSHHRAAIVHTPRSQFFTHRSYDQDEEESEHCMGILECLNDEA